MNLSMSRRLKKIITTPEPSFLMEAHSGLSAKLVERAGFQGIWASGLTIATALGLRDANEVSSTQFQEQVEYILDSVDIPVLIDGDTGHGNFNNARRFVHKMCNRGVAGICIEDKLFPKKNSFINDKQELEDINTFCGKIAACKDVQPDPDFLVIARVEALIAGHSMDEALDRAYAYADAGADAILIHSKKQTAAEIIEFSNRWNEHLPLVIVPTTYAKTPADVFRSAKISLVIWANHTLRASIKAMGVACRQVAALSSVSNIERDIASIEEIFQLLNYQELDCAEARYLTNFKRELRA